MFKRELSLIIFNILFIILSVIIKIPQTPFIITLLISNTLLFLTFNLNRRNLNETSRKLKKCSEEYREFVEQGKIREETFHMMIHDLKSPLLFVKGSVELMLEGKGGKINGEQRELLEMALRGCNRVLTIISNILDLDKIKKGEYKLIREDFSLKDFLKEEIKLFEKKCEIYGKKFIFETNFDNSAKINADKKILLRIIENLISNAIRHSSEENGIVKFNINYNREEECFYFYVFNNGEKIDENLKKEIFKKYTLSSASYNKGGSGLGLYFCKIATNLHGGDIWIENSDETGTTFVFKICNPNKN